MCVCVIKILPSIQSPNWSFFPQGSASVTKLMCTIISGGAIFGTELAQSEPRPAGLEELEEPFRSLARENLPQYEKMRALRLNPRHL